MLASLLAAPPVMGPRSGLCAIFVRDEPAISYSNRGGNSSNNGNVSSLFTMSLIDDLILLIERRAVCYFIRIFLSRSATSIDVRNTRCGRAETSTIPIRFKSDLIGIADFGAPAYD